MTITHEPVHSFVHKPARTERRPRTVTREPEPSRARPHPHLQRPDEPEVDVFLPRRTVRVDTTFWQHRSIFAGTQEQLDELRREADQRAAERAVLEAHRPAIRRLKAIVHVGLVPMLWNITTCRCGDRWPCNEIKQYLRRRWGWTTDITDHLKALTSGLPKPTTRWSRLRRLLTGRGRVESGGAALVGCGRVSRPNWRR